MKTDLTYLRNMSGGNEEVVKEMVGIFIEQVKEISDGMHQAVADKEWVALSKIAHKAKSSVAVMGMKDLSEELKRLEHTAAEGKDIEEYKGIVAQFDSDCKVAIQELTEHR